MRTAILRSLPFVVASLALACTAALTSLSCGGPNFNYYGDWMGNRHLVRPDLTPDIAYTAGRVTVSIKKNGTFDMTNMGIPTSGPARNEGDRMILHTDSLMGLPLTHSPGAEKTHPDVTMTPQPDGTLLLSDPMAIDGKPLKMVRQKP